MSDLSIEAIKQLDLVEFLSCHYGLEFSRQGAAYVCRSPFSDDQNPSFFVRLVSGHWLFKDFSSGAGGTIFDFVWIKEKLASFAEAFAWIRRLLGSGRPTVSCMVELDSGRDNAQKDTGSDRPYDVERLYERFRGEDPQVCRDYLLGRGILPELVDSLIRHGIVVHNRYEGRSWCCFAVHDDRGHLACLDNHAVDGSGKFVLGRKIVFTCEWQAVKIATKVFVTEGIIDYLSVKTLELNPPPGIALLGNQLNFEPELLAHTQTLISALDTDDGGVGALYDLQQMYPRKDIEIYNLEDFKDPNELLMDIRKGKGRTLSPQRKLELYREFQRTDNRSELARRWGIDRSHLYEIVRECDRMLVEGFSERKPGRPPKGQPASLEEAIARIRELEAAFEKEATERERLYCRSEFQTLRLKWAEIEAAELRGEVVDEDKGPTKKPQIKKKRRKRR